jgi:hypothetical protein
LSGGDPAAVNRDIEAAAKDPKPAQVTLQWAGNNRLQVTVQSANPTRGKVLFAVTEDGLSTQVGKGENGGQTLHHAAVVRQLRELGTADKTTFEKSVNVSPNKDWNIAQLKVAVFVQDRDSGKVLGGSEIAWQH